jgi:cell division inhibitor SepF
MDDSDPATAASLDDLAACLRHIRLLADRPTLRELEKQTTQEGGFLPGTRLRRTRLTRTTLSDVLSGRKFPGKAFMLTFVDHCGVDLETDLRWEEAWDRLAARYQADPGEAEKLRRENEDLRQQLAAAKDQAEIAETRARQEQTRVQTAKSHPDLPTTYATTVDGTCVTTLHPQTYGEVRTVGEHFRGGTPVIMNLTQMDDNDAKRLVDFAAGLIFGLRGSIERVTNKVFLLSPACIELTAEAKARIAEQMLYNPDSGPASQSGPANRDSSGDTGIRTNDDLDGTDLPSTRLGSSERIPVEAASRWWTPQTPPSSPSSPARAFLRSGNSSKRRRKDRE